MNRINGLIFYYTPMYYRTMGLISLLLASCLTPLIAQSEQIWQGDVKLHTQQYQSNIAYRQGHDALEAHTYRVASGQAAPTNRGVLNIPVLIHVMHAPEDSLPGTGSHLDIDQVQAGLDRLNEAFRNQGAYAGGPMYSNAKDLAGIKAADTEIEFCLANLAPDGSPIQGINYVSTALSDVHFAALYAAENRSEDAALKARSYRDAHQYLNIWLVRSVCEDIGQGCEQRGYAYLPGAHGSPLDGVVLESAYWGNAADSMQIPIYYVGRYLNLWATSFRSISTFPCTNEQCLLYGDRVCDTPPDSTQGGPGCSMTQNSCSSDGMDVDADRNPFVGLDVEDLWENFMDLGPTPSCVNTFTEGQKLRMREALLTARNSLLQGVRCQPPAADCVVPTQLPDQPGRYTATVACTDDLGWTHFFKAATDSPATGQALLIASFRSSNQAEQSWDPASIQMVVTPAYGQGGHDLSQAAYVENTSGWFSTGRYLDIAPGLNGQNLIMRLYYDSQDLIDLDQALIPQLRQGPLDLTPYTIQTKADPADGHLAVDPATFQWYEAHARGPVPQWAVWQDTGVQATVLEWNGAQTVGLGSGGLGRGYGPLYPRDIPVLTGIVNSCRPSLKWQTERQWDVERFEVLESRLGGPFVKVGQIQASPDSLPMASLRTYEWKGDSLTPGTYRYMIKAYHRSGWTQQSDTIQMMKTLDQLEGIRIFPNPARDQIQVSMTLESETEVYLQILDGTRRSVRRYRWRQQPGGLQTIHLGGLRAGIYFYQLSHGSLIRQGKLLVIGH